MIWGSSLYMLNYNWNKKGLYMKYIIFIFPLMQAKLYFPVMEISSWLPLFLHVGINMHEFKLCKCTIIAVHPTRQPGQRHLLDQRKDHHILFARREQFSDPEPMLSAVPLIFTCQKIMYKVFLTCFGSIAFLILSFFFILLHCSVNWLSYGYR